MLIGRYSGLPLAKDELDELKESIKDNFDKLEEELGKCTSDNAEVFNDRLNEFDKQNKTRYKYEDNIRYPDSTEEMKKLIEEYGTSIMFCLDDNGDVVAYIMD